MKEEKVRQALTALLLFGDEFGHAEAIDAVRRLRVSFYSDLKRRGFVIESGTGFFPGERDRGLPYKLTDKAWELIRGDDHEQHNQQPGQSIP